MAFKMNKDTFNFGEGTNPSDKLLKNNSSDVAANDSVDVDDKTVDEIKVDAAKLDELKQLLNS